MKRFFIPFLLSALAACICLSGCSWMGRTAGKAQASIERGAHDLQQGYKQGYNEEKSGEDSRKSGPAQSGPARSDNAQAGSGAGEPAAPPREQAPPPSVTL